MSMWFYIIISSLKRKKKKIEKKKLIMVKKISYTLNVNSLDTRGEIAEFAYRVDLDEVAHNDPPHLDIHRLPSSLWILNMI